MKRLFDIVMSGLGLAALWPLFLVLAAWIKRDSPGPAFYRGERMGLAGKPFRIFKFRTMIADAETRGGPSTSGDDPRITAPGRFIRKLKLDEFAQLLNVFTGDMSLVGPRPEVRKYVEQYTDEEKVILTVRPGITDLASIWNADEGAVLAKAADPDLAYEQLIRPTKIKLQLDYVRTRSFVGDIKLILYTARKLIAPEWRPPELDGHPPPAAGSGGR